MNLFVHHWGPSQPNPLPRITFLHGMGGTGALWHAAATTIENHYNIIAIDQPGHGQSRVNDDALCGPKDFGLSIIETLQTESHLPSFFVGHSMGVRSALACAQLKPELVQGLILVDLGLSGSHMGDWGRRFIEFVQKLPEAFPSREAARNFMNSHCPDLSIAQYLMAVSFRSADGNVRFPFQKNTLLKIVEQSKGLDLHVWAKEAAKRRIPILILRGAQSQVYTREAYDEDRHELESYSSIRFEEWPNCGHGLPFEKRREFCSRIQQFVSEALSE